MFPEEFEEQKSFVREVLEKMKATVEQLKGDHNTWLCGRLNALVSQCATMMALSKSLVEEDLQHKQYLDTVLDTMQSVHMDVEDNIGTIRLYLEGKDEF